MWECECEWAVHWLFHSFDCPSNHSVSHRYQWECRSVMNFPPSPLSQLSNLSSFSATPHKWTPSNVSFRNKQSVEWKVTEWENGRWRMNVNERGNESRGDEKVIKIDPYLIEAEWYCKQSHFQPTISSFCQSAAGIDIQYDTCTINVRMIILRMSVDDRRHCR